MGFTGVEIREVKPTSDDDRGSTFEWCKGLPGMQTTIYTRKKGTLPNKHYHKGEDISKNPERLLLIDGTAMFRADNGLTEQNLDVRINAFCEIIIEPGILHSVEAITDIKLLEHRATVFYREKPDTYPEDSYLDYIKELKK